MSPLLVELPCCDDKEPAAPELVAEDHDAVFTGLLDNDGDAFAAEPEANNDD